MTDFKLILLRHGESEWNRQNLFTGWHDCPLSEKGREEAAGAGELLAEQDFSVLHTSELKRASQTADIVLEMVLGKREKRAQPAKAELPKIPVKKSWRLNERHYGNLTGLDKKQAVADFGAEQVFAWRRKYNVRPPEISTENPYSEGIASQFGRLEEEGLLPAAECLADVLERLLPYWEDSLLPDLREYRNVLVVAHGNSLRAIIKYLDGISEDEISALNIPTGIPLVYGLGENFQPSEKLPIEDRYLGDTQAAIEAAELVSRQTSGSGSGSDSASD